MHSLISRLVAKFDHRTAVLVMSALVISACATSESTRPRATIETEEQVGFTITEDVQISSSARSNYDVALHDIEQGNVAEGIALLEAVAEGAPHSSAPRIDLGIAHHRAGNLEAAERNLLLALESSPDHPITHNELGIVYRKTGRFTEARASYEAALAVYPGFHYARRNLAILCDLYLADLGCALENYEAYMATVQSDDEASMWISDIRTRMGQPDE